MLTDPAIQALHIVFPKEIFTWFDIVKVARDDKMVHIVFEEKNNPPPYDTSKKIISKGFTDITITDFPIRGRKTFLTFRRRYWKVKGQKEFLKRDIKIAFPGTQLEEEFALFLKEKGRGSAGKPGLNRPK
jgi:hypothetical protein